jgi:hypothetical protein
MKRLFTLSAAVGMLALAAAAQQQEDAMKVKAKMEADRIQKMIAESKVMGFAGAMGPAVKGAPYSAVEVNESTQVLADGTRIHNERQTNVWRDSEGRVRRETPEEITIWDPVENVTYFLDTKSQTGKKATMSRVVTKTGTEGGQLEQRTVTIKPDGPPPEPMLAEYGQRLFFVYQSIGSKADAEMKAQKLAIAKQAGKAESLGQQMIEGVPSEGTRTTETLEAGAIGNDRPIQVVNERWYSSDLQTVVMTKHTDPRTGEEIFRLTNVSRGEPPAGLFQVPAGYQIQGQK